MINQIEEIDRLKEDLHNEKNGDKRRDFVIESYIEALIHYRHLILTRRIDPKDADRAIIEFRRKFSLHQPKKEEPQETPPSGQE